MANESEPYFFSTPEQFFDRVVLPNYAEFIANQISLRLAMNAAIACLSMRDWVLESERCGGIDPERGRRGLQEELIKLEPSFQHLTAVAVASKHYQVEKGPGAGLLAADMKVDFFRAGDPCGHPLRPIKVELPDGTNVFFRDLLVSAVIMWARYLGRDPRSITELQSY